jgi:hypothetical protein
MIEEELPSINPKLDAMCEMLKTIHDLNERNKMLEAKVEKMRNCGNCNGIVAGGIRTEKCKFCINSKDLPRWELRND